MNAIDRRKFVTDLGISSAALPFLMGLPSLGLANTVRRKQRLIIMFSPNGTIPETYWPEKAGDDFELNEIMKPLADFKDRMLVLRGIANRVTGDGDRHMRGMSCLLTGIELFPGNIQGGSDTPAGWASGISIDQELRNFLQKNAETRTRFGSLEFGVGVPDRADPWTRMSYAGPNKPIAPTDDPYEMYKKLYGRMTDRKSLQGILDDVRADLKKVSTQISPEDRALLQEHEALVRRMERDLEVASKQKLRFGAPELSDGVANQNDNVPELSRMQIDLLVNSLANDMARIATLQYTKSVGQARMKWLDINDSHHTLSHKPDKDKKAQDELTRINTWFAGELAYLAGRLADTPEPGSDGSMLDHTTIVWTNELGRGNNHTLDNIPMLLIGGGLGFRMGRSLALEKTAHNRLLLAIAHAMGHQLETFGNARLSAGGPLDLS
jgi:hypothetical protein